MTRSARRTIARSARWMCDCGQRPTQPWWRPCSVAWTVTSHGTSAARARRSAARATSQSCECTRSNSSVSSSSAPAARMSSFMWSTQRMKPARSSFGYSGSRTRCTVTPWRSSSASRFPPPRVTTWTSAPQATRFSASLRTCLARPPSTIGGYSQVRIRTRVATRGGRLSSRAPADGRLAQTRGAAMARVLYEAGATVTGGRAEGHGRTSDGALEVELRSPPELGGEGGGTNPEQLFAIGFAACFEGALGVVGRRARAEVGDVSIDSRVQLIPTEDRRMRLGVELHVTLPQVTDAESAKELVAAAHELCPYSNATRGNVDVVLTANGQAVE